MRTPSALSYDTAQIARFGQLVFWSMVASACFSLIYLAVYLLTSDMVVMIMDIAVFGFLLSLVAAQRLLLRGRLAEAVVIYCITLLVCILISAVVVPSTYPTLLIGVLMLVVIALMYTDGRLQGAIITISIIVMVAVILLCEFVQLFPVYPAEIMILIRIISNLTLGTLVLWLLQQFGRNLKASLSDAHSANAALRDIQATLAHQVADRTVALQRALDALQEREGRLVAALTTLQMSQDTIQELSVPVLPISRDTLVMPLIGAIDSARMLQIEEQALGRIEQTRARHLILDITGVPVVDSSVAQGILKLVHSARLIGAEVVVVGIRPEVAQTIVGLGLDLSDIRTYTDIQSALHRIIARPAR